MTLTKLARAIMLSMVCLLVFANVSQAQSRTVTGKVTDSKGEAIPSATVTVKGTQSSTSTGADGSFSLNVPAGSNTLVISSVGYTTQEVNISGRNEIAIILEQSNAALNEVVVVGYGTARKRDLTGSVTKITAKDFNTGAIVAPDQLIQGKVPGVQVLATNGAPGAAFTVRIRGNNSIRAGSQPLFVLDGVPLDGRTARPELNASGIGSSPANNPLNFINPDDIASIEVLKDASAAAIYGSRGANGVIMITTKRGNVGKPTIDFSTAVGTSSILRNIEVMNGDQYRNALKTYNLTKGNYGGNVNAMDAITRNVLLQNHSLSMSGGSDGARYRASIGFFDQNGILLKSDFKKYTAAFMGNFKFLDSKKLGLDVSLFTTNIQENVAPVTNNAGFQGSLVINALQWNPTLSLMNGDKIRQSTNDPNVAATTVNPLALSRYYNDKIGLNKIFVVASPYYTFNKKFEYRANVSLTQETGTRRAWMSRLINIDGVKGQGWASLGEAGIQTYLFNQTLTYRTDLTKKLNLNALIGYEFMDLKFRRNNQLYRGFGIDEFDYTKLINSAAQVVANEGSSYEDPTTQLQSYFTRVGLNYDDKYLFTATIRSDGSTKFGDNFRYGIFPSFAARWNLHNESFLAGNKVINQLALRLGWGITGNQEFPSGAARERYAYTAGGGAALLNAANPDLQWESSTTLNVGLDFATANNKVTGTIDYFRRNTNKLLFNFEVIQPAPPGSRIWQNLDGTIINSGVELGIFYNMINKKDVAFDLGVNATFLQNDFQNYSGPQILTGALHGQGVSGASVQQMRNGLPLNAFFTRKWTGLDASGNNKFDQNEKLQYVGNPNPKTLLGFSTDLRYKKFSFRTNWNGAFGHDIYNNTFNSVLNVSNLQSERNIASVFVGGPKESLTNPASPSSRYLEKGGFLRFTNATISYAFGNVGKVFKNVNLSLTGQNLAVFTKFKGFDPEVNVDKQINGVSSFGIEYAPYPSARNFLLGLRVSL